MTTLSECLDEVDYAAFQYEWTIFILCEPANIDPKEIYNSKLY